MLARIFEPEAFGITHTKKQPPDPLKTIGVDCNGSFESDKKDNEHNGGSQISKAKRSKDGQDELPSRLKGVVFCRNG